MILTKEQMKTLIREQATKIRMEMELEREKSRRISELEKRKAEILSILNDGGSDGLKDGMPTKS